MVSVRKQSPFLRIKFDVAGKDMTRIETVAGGVRLEAYCFVGNVSARAVLLINERRRNFKSGEIFCVANFYCWSDRYCALCQILKTLLLITS